MAANALADVEWLRSHGVEILPPNSSPTVRVSTAIAAPGPFAGMPNVFRSLLSRLPTLGATLVFDTKARQILFDEKGAVAGVRASGPQDLIDYRAPAVVIAMGGYAGNTAMLEAFGDPNAGAMMVRGIKHATGDGLILAQSAGAGLNGMGGIMSLHIAAVDPVETAAGQPAVTVPYAISISRDGKRFVDESRGYVAHGKAVLDQPGQTTNLMLDQAIRQVTAVEGVFGTYARLGLKIHQADTLEALAEMIRVPAAEMIATVDAFNAAAADGTAPDAQPPKAKLAIRIETAPFCAISPLAPGITLTFGGIMIDKQARERFICAAGRRAYTQRFEQAQRRKFF